MVGLDIDTDLVFQPEALEETIHRLRIEIILVLGRLVRLGFDQDRAGKADLVLVLDHKVEETAEVFLLDADLGIEDGVVPLAPTPQHVICAAQPMRRLQRIAYLTRGPGVDFGIGVSGGARHVARVAEQVRGAPQQLAAMLRLQRFEMVDSLGKAAAEAGDVVGIGHHVDIVEAIERHIELLDEGQRRFSLGFRRGGVVRTGMPWAAEGAGTEHIAARPAESVPKAHRHAQVIFHALAQHLAVLVVPAVGEIVAAGGSFVADGVKRGEIVCGHEGLLLKPGNAWKGGAKPGQFGGEAVGHRGIGFNGVADRGAHADVAHTGARGDLGKPGRA